MLSRKKGAASHKQINPPKTNPQALNPKRVKGTTTAQTRKRTRRGG